MKKEGMKVGNGSGATFPKSAKGGNLAEGLSHYEKAGDVDGMYARDDTKQRAAKGHDRI